MNKVHSQSSATEEIARGRRFGFGKNWRSFLSVVDEDRVQRAMRSLEVMLDEPTLTGKVFLDAGSGSGLFSLAAYRLGATVFSFDFDPESVSCTRLLKEKEGASDTRWQVQPGSALDESFIRSLPDADIVYSWGVLHHTGRMYEALELVAGKVQARGKLFVAIYNDQGAISRMWKMVKATYNRAPALRWPIILVFSPYLFGGRFLVRILTGRLRELRGMSLWFDMIDWLGGYPFEVAKPEEIIFRVQPMGFKLIQLKTSAGRHGCNEFVFERCAESW